MLLTFQKCHPLAQRWAIQGETRAIACTTHRVFTSRNANQPYTNHTLIYGIYSKTIVLADPPKQTTGLKRHAARLLSHVHPN